MPHRHHEVMRRKPDPPLRRLELHRALHHPRHEPVGLGPLRPAALVEPADDQRADRLQTRLQGAPDGDPSVAAGRRLDDFSRDQRGSDIRPLVARDGKVRRRGDQRTKEGGKPLARFAFIEASIAARLVASQRFEGRYGDPCHLGDRYCKIAATGDQRSERRAQAAEHQPRLGKLARADPGQPERLAAGCAERGVAAVEEGQEVGDVGSPGAAAQRHQLDRFGSVPNLGAPCSELQERMLEQGGDRHRVARPEDRLEQQRQEFARGRSRQRRSSEIVGPDAEPQELGADPSRQVAIGGDQRRRRLRLDDCAAQRGGDRHRLVMLVRRFGQRHAGKGGFEFGRRETGAAGAPVVRGFGRPQGLGQDRSTARQRFVERADPDHLAAVSSHLAEQACETELRVAEHRCGRRKLVDHRP